MDYSYPYIPFMMRSALADPHHCTLIDEISIKLDRILVDYCVDILGHYPKPYWDLSYSGLWGLRCEQSPDTSSRCDTPIYYKVEILGGQKWLIIESKRVT